MKFGSISYLLSSAIFLSDIAVAQLSDGPLVQPAEFSSNDANGEFSLSLTEGEHSTVAATAFNTRLLGGTLPGPTVRVKKGDWLYINFLNDLSPQQGTTEAQNGFAYPDSTNLHFHGAHVSGERPGDDTTIIVDPGQTFNYEVFFPQYHMGGTHWIHPHRHGSGTIQVAGGASTAMIVEDDPGDVPPEVESAEEVVLVVQLFDTIQMRRTARDSGDNLFNLESVVGDTFTLVNGQYRPALEITAGEWQRWRVVFASWDMNPLDLSMITGGVCEMNLLAKDGIYINDYPRPLTFYPISTAGRADIMVRCSETGTFPVNDYLGELFTLNIVEPDGPIDVSTPPTSGFQFPTPIYLNDLQGRTPTPGCTCDTRLAPDNTVNGLSYDPDIFVHKVAEGSLVQRNLMGISAHPYHQHVYPFQITQANGIDQQDSDYHKIGDYHDTLMIRSAARVQIKYEANNFLGRMAVHCHRLPHSDAGMLTFEDVVDPATGGVCECSPSTDAVGFTRAPTPAPVTPTAAPVAPTNAPVAPTVAPVDPTNAPVTPTAAPVAPTNAPVAPTNAPVDPTSAPVAPTNAPVAPMAAPITPTNAPVSPTLAPITPTNAPVNPTTAPVEAPPSECVDSPLRAIVERRSRDCNWIERNGYCSNNRYRSHCRVRCDRCDQCEDSRANFVFQPDPSSTRTTRESCQYVQDNLDLCELSDIAATCPQTCGMC